MKVLGKEQGCVKKNLKSIDYMRQKVLKKIYKAFWKFYKENIEIIENGGWHFNSIISPAEISKKLKTFAHTEFSKNQYSDINIIKKNIEEHKDLFGRNITYTKVNMDNSFPEYILKNKNNLKRWFYKIFLKFLSKFKMIFSYHLFHFYLNLQLNLD